MIDGLLSAELPRAAGRAMYQILAARFLAVARIKYWRQQVRLAPAFCLFVQHLSVAWVFIFI